MVPVFRFFTDKQHHHARSNACCAEHSPRRRGLVDDTGVPATAGLSPPLCLVAYILSFNHLFVNILIDLKFLLSIIDINNLFIYNVYMIYD